MRFDNASSVARRGKSRAVQEDGFAAEAKEKGENLMTIAYNIEMNTNSLIFIFSFIYFIIFSLLSFIDLMIISIIILI